MNDFTYHAPTSLDEALAALRGGGDGAKLIAGGHSLLPVMKLNLASPTDLVSLAGVPGLGDIADGGDSVTVGAMCRHAQVAGSAVVQARIPALAAMADGIGDAQVRNAGTIGGSVAHNDPAADYPAACVALGATIVTDRREIHSDDFFQGMFATALADDEVVTAVRFPVPARAAYAKFANPASKYAVAGVMVADGPAGVRVAVTGASGDGVFRVAEMEAALGASFSGEAVAGVAVSSDGMLSDTAAGADYRAHLVTVMAKRAVEACG
ncbi:MAG: xanthine dehydrogenase family protein subunit M [Gemmatimonadetes bacterium]|nr:xanthine dehydrogenase family protein subunit M [Gemmatimonadota bacterium]MYA43452.1 xanthine dehydrogenase family protein subunit M [Gemmatimonadota bacterium]MYE94008.1 xanthine dehydrogenase family protein subunit M [Gemmatimonadota bacterium]MYJ11320.1 xanthine dehydrogenase family protein subunit M [Gemmatimonadota bacterium]